MRGGWRPWLVTLAGIAWSAALPAAETCGWTPRERTVQVGGAPRLLAFADRLALIDGNGESLRLAPFDLASFKPGPRAPQRRTGPVFAAPVANGWIVVDTEMEGVPRIWRADAAGRIAGPAQRLPGHGWPLALIAGRPDGPSLLCLGGRDAAAPIEIAFIGRNGRAAAAVLAAAGARAAVGWAPVSGIVDGDGFLVAVARHTAGPGLTLARVTRTGEVLTLEATDEEVWHVALAEDGKRRWGVAMGPAGTHAWPLDAAGQRGKPVRLLPPGERVRRLLDARIVDGLLRVLWAEPFGLATLMELSPKSLPVELGSYHPRTSDVIEGVVVGDGAVFMWTTGFDVANVTSLHLEEETRVRPGGK